MQSPLRCNDFIRYGGDTGFDVGYKPQGACRGADFLVNLAANNLVANDDNYALAA